MVGLFIESLRPKQWTKNLLLFAGILFSENLFYLPYLLKAFAGFFLFCVVSGAVYLINDVLDLEQDRAHPLKSQRPIASGKLSPIFARVMALVMVLTGITLSYMINTGFGRIVAAYVLAMLAYTFVLKYVVVLDIIVIATGFVLRAAAGAVIIGVSISSWLLVCTIFLALFLALSKRRHELVLLGEDAHNHRRILKEYTPHLLDQMIAVVTASAVMSYALYTTSADTVEKFGTRNLIFTLPFVLYGIFRYLYLVHQKKMGGSPELVLIRDWPMICNIVIYILTAGIIIYYKP